MNSTKTATYGLWIALICMVGFGMFVMKDSVQALESELNQLNKGIQEDIKTIHILKAEWSHLNNPSRLRKLSQKHNLLNPLKAEQIINYSALPFEYESAEGNRKLAARKNITKHAAHNKDLKRLVNSQR